MAIPKSWNPFVRCGTKTLSQAQMSVRLWIFDSTRLKMYAAHRILQRSLPVWMAVMRCLCDTVPTHIVTLRSIFRSS